MVVVVFCLRGISTQWGETVLAVGDRRELGGWAPEQAIGLSTDANNYPQWRTSEVRLEPAETDGAEIAIRYKYVRDCREIGQGVEWEDRGDREARIPAGAGSVWLVTDVAFNSLEPGELTQLAGPPLKEHTPEPGTSPNPAAFEDAYELLGGDPVAKGGFSSVWRCRPRPSATGAGGTKFGGTLAVKRITKSQMPQRTMRFLFGHGTYLGEIHLHRGLRHPSVVELREVFDDAAHVSLVMEYCAGGDLLEIILGHHKNFGRGLPEPAAASVTQQLLCAMAYVHKRRIIHRDVKCENIFQLQASGTVPLERATFKLGDFGLAAQIQLDEVLLEQVGSPSTSAPEVIHGRPYGQPADMWSAGAVLYTALAARRPFEASTYAQMVRNASRGQVILKGGHWDAASAAACALLESLMQPDPAKRPTADAALEHPWLHHTARALSSRGLLAAAGDAGREVREVRLGLWGWPICSSSRDCCGLGLVLPGWWGLVLPGGSPRG